MVPIDVQNTLAQAAVEAVRKNGASEPSLEICFKEDGDDFGLEVLIGQGVEPASSPGSTCELDMCVKVYVLPMTVEILREGV